MPTIYEITRGREPRVVGPHYGIEIEAEGLPEDEYHRLSNREPFDHPSLRDMYTHWQVKGDGSLRHNGVEFASPPLTMDQVAPAVQKAARLFSEGIVRTHVRAGIHVHLNMQDKTMDDLRQLLETYILMEPLLYQVAGDVREQSIYCVPLYRADNELVQWQRIFSLSPGKYHQIRGAIESTCKYSGLYLAPLRREFGTIEFRMAPTWTEPEPLIAWVRLMEFLYTHVLDTQDEQSVLSLKGLVGPLLRGTFRVDWNRYFREVDERGLYARARSLKPCTYKVKGWGKPAGMAFPVAAKERPEPTVRVPRTPRARRVPEPGRPLHELFVEQTRESIRRVNEDIQAANRARTFAFTADDAGRMTRIWDNQAPPPTRERAFDPPELPDFPEPDITEEEMEQMHDWLDDEEEEA